MSDVARLMELARQYVPPPENVDVPAVMPMSAAVGDTLTCSVGNWNNVPTHYEYLWLADSTAPLSGAESYIVAEGDAGHSISCVVTATNAIGSTTAPPSNAVAIAALGATRAQAADDDEHERAGPPSARGSRK